MIVPQVVDRSLPGVRSQPLRGGRRYTRAARPASPAPGTEEARRKALDERRAAARREPLLVTPDDPPFLRVRSPSSFTYRVHLRGGATGPHSCDCPDFEANRLHTCKHVERVRVWLAAPRSRLPRSHRRDAQASRVFLHFGEVVEPRLFGRPSGRGSRAVSLAFDGNGVPLTPFATDHAELRIRLRRYERWVEPQALQWIDQRLERTPELPRGDFARLLPPLGLTPYRYQWDGAAFLARTGRALLADEMGLGKTVQAILAAAAPRLPPRDQRNRGLPGQPAGRLAGRNPPLPARGGRSAGGARPGPGPDDRLAAAVAHHPLRAGPPRPPAP